MARGCSASDKAAPSIATLRRSQSLGNLRYDDRAISGGRIPFSELVKGLDVSRPPEQEALALVAILPFKELQFGGRLDALGENRKTERATSDRALNARSQLLGH